MKKWTKVTLWGLLIALAMAALIAPFASILPDGLEKVAETRGFSAKATTLFSALLPDYLMPLGVLIVFVLVYGLGRLLSKQTKNG